MACFDADRTMAPLNDTTNSKPSSQNGAPRSNTNKPSPTKAPSVNGVGRSPSIRGGLARPTRGGTNRSSPQTSSLGTNAAASNDASEDDARAENMALIDELRTRLQKAEAASEEYQRQLNLLQARLDESQQSHGHLEDQLHEKSEKVEELEVEKIQAARLKREVEGIFEQERVSMLKDREEQTAKAEEMKITIQRLKENLAQREPRSNSEDRKDMARSCRCPKSAPWAEELTTCSKWPICSPIISPTQRLVRDSQSDRTERKGHRISAAGARRSSNKDHGDGQHGRRPDT